MKTAIVTGASQGIGAGMIQVFLELRAAFRSLH
jgi:NAD(P)-dependent dehydrogenase (short-subunit alcohol dehydrogenase family)